MKILLNLGLLMLAGSIATTAQPQRDFRRAVGQEISRRTSWTSTLDTHKPFAYFFAVAISFDKDGKVDTAYFTENLREEIASILKPKELATHLMKSNLISGRYKDKVVMYPLIYRYQPTMSIPFDDIAMRDWLNLWPVFNARDKQRQLVLLQPYENTFYIIDN